MRLVAHLVVLVLGCAARSLLWAGPSPDDLARGIRTTISDAVAANAAHTLTTSSLGANLADYANNIGRDPTRYEPLAAAARRILAGDRTPKQPPDITSRALEQSATALLAALASTPAHPPADSADSAATAAALRLTAHLARFHAQRIIAAVHYNLFKRGLRLAELLAATAREKEAVATWREAVAAATAGNLASAPALRAELKQLELNLKELEEQCCPPDEAILKEKVWQPVANP